MAKEIQKKKKKRQLSAEMKIVIFLKEVQWVFGIMCKIRRSLYCV